MSGDSEVLRVTIFLQRFFRHISVDHVLVDSRHHRRERRLITDSKRRIATIRIFSFSFAGAVSANAGLVFIENFVHARQIVELTRLDIVVHVAFLSAHSLSDAVKFVTTCALVFIAWASSVAVGFARTSIFAADFFGPAFPLADCISEALASAVVIFMEAGFFALNPLVGVIFTAFGVKRLERTHPHFTVQKTRIRVPRVTFSRIDLQAYDC